MDCEDNNPASATHGYTGATTVLAMEILSTGFVW